MVLNASRIAFMFLLFGGGAAVAGAAEVPVEPVASTETGDAPKDEAPKGQAIVELKDPNVEPARELHLAPELAIALPQPLQIGLEAHYDPRFRAFADLGYLKLNIGGSSRSVTLYDVHAGARWSPWNRWFFFTGAFGYRRIQLVGDISALKISGESIASTGNADLQTFYFAPGFGFNWDLSRKLSLNFDLGYQLPLHSYGSLSFEDRSTGENSANSPRLRVDSDRAMSRVAAIPIPQLTLLRFVWRMD